MSTQERRQELLQAFGRVGREVSAATVMFHAAVADSLGLNPTDHKCVDLLVTHGPLTAGQIAEKTGLTSGAITGVIDRLEAAGYARREPDPEDRRRVIVAPIAETIDRDIAPLFQSLGYEWRDLCADYTDEEIERVIDVLTRSAGILRAKTQRLKARMEAAGESSATREEG